MSQPGLYGGPTSGSAPQRFGAPPPGYQQYPFPPGQGGGPPRPPKKKKAPLWIALGIVGLVVVLVGGGTTTWVLIGSSGGGFGSSASARMSGQIAWQLPPPNTENEMINSWASDGVLVHGTPEKLVAYANADGKKQWELSSPGMSGVQGKNVFCGMSPSAERGVGVVTYGTLRPGDYSGKRCSGVMLVDLKTGQPRWTVELPSSGASAQDKLTPHIAGNIAVVPHENAVVGLNLNDGKRAWSYEEKARHFCGVRDMEANARSVAFVSNCGSSKDPGTVSVMNPATGKVKSEQPIQAQPAGGYVTEIISVDPIVMNVTTYESILDSKNQYVFADELGRQTATVPADGPYGSLDTQSITDSGERTYRTVTSNGLFITSTNQQPSTEFRFTNQIVAFDVKTGQVRWNVSLGPEVTAAPIAATPNGVLVINGGTASTPAQVHELSAKDGKATPVSPPFPPSKLIGIDREQLHWDQNTVYAVEHLSSRTRPIATALK